MRSLKWIVLAMLLILGTGAGVVWWQREPLQVWWTLRGLAQADEATRETWVDRLVALGEPTIAPLTDRLVEGEDQACQNILLALDRLARARGLTDPVAADIATRLARLYPRFAPSTQAALIRRLTGWFEQATPAEETIAACARILGEAATAKEPEVQERGVELASVLVQCTAEDSVVSAGREMAHGGLRSSSPSVRLKAIRLSLQPHVHLLEQVVGLLRDPSVEVRRAAILAVGPADQVVREDTLLPGLHDEDKEVRKLTESALRSRGLRPEHLELGRLLTHPQPTTRLQVLDRIRDLLDAVANQTEVDLDPGVWLRRLSHDQAPGVRAAALRLMSEQRLIDLDDRIDQMARSDPSPSVAQLAQYYLRRRQSPAPVDR